jgi:hypothetical protein
VFAYYGENETPVFQLPELPIPEGALRTFGTFKFKLDISLQFANSVDYQHLVVLHGLTIERYPEVTCDRYHMTQKNMVWTDSSRANGARFGLDVAVYGTSILIFGGDVGGQPVSWAILGTPITSEGVSYGYTVTTVPHGGDDPESVAATTESLIQWEKWAHVLMVEDDKPIMDTVKSFNPETIITYEVGVKSQFLENRVRFNTAVFYSDYKDMQLLILNTTASGGYVALTENAAKSRISGVEAELTAMPVPRVELTAGVGYLDSQVQSAVPNSGVVPGDRLMEAPRWSGNASAQYTQPVATGALKFRADCSVKSDVFQDAQNTPAIRSGGYGLLNARIGYAPDAPGWSAALFVTNITNKRYTLAGYDAGAFGFGFALWGPPREFGASVAYRF